MNGFSSTIQHERLCEKSTPVGSLLVLWFFGYNKRKTNSTFSTISCLRRKAPPSSNLIKLNSFFSSQTFSQQLNKAWRSRLNGEMRREKKLKKKKKRKSMNLYKNNIISLMHFLATIFSLVCQKCNVFDKKGVFKQTNKRHQSVLQTPK